MPSSLSPAFAYTIVYVEDVERSKNFYEKAFGYRVHRLDQSHRWGELKSGPTTIAVTRAHQRETDELSGSVQTPRSVPDQKRNPVELCSAYSDVDAAYKNGAEPVSEPEPKEWGQKVGYVRDIDGIVVRMGSFVHPSQIQ